MQESGDSVAEGRYVPILLRSGIQHHSARVQVLAMEELTKSLIFPLSQRPEWRCDPRALTFLMTDRQDRFAAKQWFQGRKDPIDYARVYQWKPFVAMCDGIEGLALVMARAAEFPRLTAIRGAVRQASADKSLVNRRLHQHLGEPAPDIEDVPRCWLMVDLDSLPEPEDFDWRNDPSRAAIWAAREHLPTVFQNSAFYYQYSGSAGIKPGLRLHFWFWLEAPMGSIELKRYIERVGKGKADLSLYNAVQPHYTATPLFRGVDDPMANSRGGLVL